MTDRYSFKNGHGKPVRFLWETSERHVMKGFVAAGG